MIDAGEVGEIIKQYEKHGWKLRRALLSPEGRARLSEMNGIEVVESDLDALWFARRSKPDTETWELRRLTGSPFALVAVISSDAASEKADAALNGVVEEMREKTMA